MGSRAGFSLIDQNREYGQRRQEVTLVAEAFNLRGASSSDGEGVGSLREAFRNGSKVILTGSLVWTSEVRVIRS